MESVAEGIGANWCWEEGRETKSRGKSQKVGILKERVNVLTFAIGDPFPIFLFLPCTFQMWKIKQ